MQEIEMQTSEINVEKHTNNKKIVWIVGIFLLVGVVVIVLLLCNLGGTGTYLTYENYCKIQTGMSYNQVVEVLDNHNGTLDSTSSYEDYTFSIYTWSNSSGTRCIVVSFDNGKVSAKSQYGLN